MAEQEYTIFCVVQDQWTPFSIAIEPNKRVDQLKNKIKEAKKPEFDGIAPDSISLYNISVDATGLSARVTENRLRENAQRLIQDVDAILSPLDEVGEIYSAQPPKKMISILIVPPFAKPPKSSMKVRWDPESQKDTQDVDMKLEEIPKTSTRETPKETPEETPKETSKDDDDGESSEVEFDSKSGPKVYNATLDFGKLFEADAQSFSQKVYALGIDRVLNSHKRTYDEQQEIIWQGLFGIPWKRKNEDEDGASGGGGDGGEGGNTKGKQREASSNSQGPSKRQKTGSSELDGKEISEMVEEDCQTEMLKRIQTREDWDNRGW